MRLSSFLGRPLILFVVIAGKCDAFDHNIPRTSLSPHALTDRQLSVSFNLLAQLSHSAEQWQSIKSNESATFTVDRANLSGLILPITWHRRSHVYMNTDYKLYMCSETK